MLSWCTRTGWDYPGRDWKTGGMSQVLLYQGLLATDPTQVSCRLRRTVRRISGVLPVHFDTVLMGLPGTAKVDDAPRYRESRPSFD